MTALTNKTFTTTTKVQPLRFGENNGDCDCNDKSNSGSTDGDNDDDDNDDEKEEAVKSFNTKLNELETRRTREQLQLSLTL